ncbi:MAG: IS630 family transposase [Desulfomonilaceae bacterium]
MARRGLRLTPGERRRIIEEREVAKRNKQWWISIRLRSLLLCDEGKTMEEAARICEVARSTVGEWIRKYRQGGLEGVKQRGPYAGKAPKLSPSQYQELREIIRGGPEAAGLDTGVWTAAVVAEAPRKRFGVRLSLSQICRTLRKLGFSVQYPRQKLSKADKERQRTWVEITLPAIKKSPERAGHIDVCGRGVFRAVRDSVSSLG